MLRFSSLTLISRGINAMSRDTDSEKNNLKKERALTLKDIGYTEKHQNAFEREEVKVEKAHMFSGQAHSVKISKSDNPLEVLRNLLS